MTTPTKHNNEVSTHHIPLENQSGIKSFTERIFEVGNNGLYCSVIQGDNRDVVPNLAPSSVDLVITSPPYFQQRSYSAEGVGNEERIEDYLNSIVDVFNSLLRVVKPNGNIVYNMGDKYIAGNLMLIPYRFALRITDEIGMKLVNDITWLKQNPAPHQFRRRLTSSTEPFFHFVMSNSYYYDRDAFMPGSVAQRNEPSPKLGQGYRRLIETSDLTPLQREKAHKALDDAIRDVHSGAIHSFRMKIRGVHAPAYGGQDGGRKIHMDREGFTIIRISGNRMKKDVIENPVGSLKGNNHPAIFPERVIRELVRMLSPQGGVVLDHYVGSGTTLAAALKERRNVIGIDISEEYCDAAIQRLLDDDGLNGLLL